MRFDFSATARFMRRQFIRRAWTTTQQKWTTSFVILGLTLATLVVPPFGIAVFGTAFAGWGAGVIILTLFFGLVGNRFGLEREKASLLREIKISNGQD
ncbi:hypothetical protein U2P60_13565 [Brucella sp. H1_1004]|uniref:hypothetical protein n=1 Tax=Brucella sp. H1_1004 TaxID=3110109 RepID=UPI0039B56B6C